MALPARRQRSFSINGDNEAILRLRVLQGEKVRADENLLLGTFHVLPLNAVEAQLGVAVDFQVNADGRFSLEARDPEGVQNLLVTVEWPPPNE